MRRFAVSNLDRVKDDVPSQQLYLLCVFAFTDSDGTQNLHSRQRQNVNVFESQTLQSRGRGADFQTEPGQTFVEWHPSFYLSLIDVPT